MRVGLVSIVVALVAAWTPAAVHAQAVALSNAVVAAVQGVAMNSPYGSLPRGLDDSSGSTTRLMIMSNRNIIASRTADAAGSGGRFTPTTEMRRDVVVMSCGDHDVREIFECSRLRVLVNGAVIAPLTYSADTNVYRNALGATWNVREVTALFDARRLVKGFTVEYASPDGAEWSFAVEPDQAAVDLLLDVSSATAATAVTGPPPTQLRVTAVRSADGWQITNNDTYRWPRCVASIGASEATMGALDRFGVATVNRAQFQPALPADSDKLPLSVTCYVGRDQMFISTIQP